ncbi:MAG: TonB-dependent receptor, partial [Acidobacteria bacterium]|nr:TonB-dependent receptor [Acidobacteriota bacterium]
MNQPIQARRSIRLAWLLLIILCAGVTQAQQAITSATLSGRIVDPNGAGVAGASVVAKNNERNISTTTLSDEEGHFRFPNLPAGSYILKIEQAGFAAATREITLTVGQSQDIFVSLSLAGVSASVVIDVPMVETTRTQVSETILPKELDRLPLNGRNTLDLALLVPGVSRTNTGSVQRFAETSAVAGQGISIAGQRNLNNSFIVDGLSANDDAADLAGTFYGEEVIREFQVVTSGGIAEFSRASSGVVNIITQSGTNDWRGRAYGFFRNQRFDARNPLASSKDPLTQAQYGLSVGGPLKRDRTFLFTNFEQTRRNDSAVITIAPSAVASINARLNAINYRGARVETGLVPSGYDATNFFARVDHKLSSRNLITMRYSLYDISASNSRNVGGLNAVSRGTALDNLDQTFAINAVTNLSSRTINEARFQYTRSRLKAPVNDETGPAVNITGVASFGTATFSPLARDIDLLEAVDNIATQRGQHSLKAGVDFLYNRVNILFPGAFQGVYNFTTLANFLTGNYSQYQQAFGAPSQFQSNPNLGLFIQDEWKPRNDLTINLGLRYDAQFLPSPIKTDTNNLAPRLGIAYAPGDRKTVFRLSAGLYYDRIPLRATSNALQRDGSKYLVAQLSPTDAGAPVFPNTLPSFPAILNTKPNITIIDPNIESSYGEQLNFQIERELPGNASVSIGYLHLRGLHLILSRNVNVPRFPASAGVPNLGRPNPNFGNISRFESSGDSYYNGLIVAFNKRASRWMSLRASYTFSKTIDDAG